ncbi:unnamed protein product [Prunus armeniaca]
MGMDELSEDDKLIVACACKIQRFLSQPFHVAEVFIGAPRKYVEFKESITNFQGLPFGPGAYRFVKHFALLRAKEKLQRQNPLGLATAVLKVEAEGRKRHGLKRLWLNRHVALGPHAPFNEGQIINHQSRALNAFPRLRGQNPRSGRWSRFAEIYGGHTTMLLNPRPPCFTIPNANLTTHLPGQASPRRSCQPRMSIQDSYKC